jgi:hypothetical protein
MVVAGSSELLLRVGLSVKGRLPRFDKRGGPTNIQPTNAINPAPMKSFGLMQSNRRRNFSEQGMRVF